MNGAHQIITESIKEATDEDAKFLYCTTQKDLFVGIKNAISEANIILIAVDVSKFISTKAALFRALGFKCRLNGEILQLLSSDKCMATLNEKQTNAHAAVPLGAEAFVTYDGLFSGVGIKAGPQKLILVPIDEKRIEAIINNGMISFAFKDVKKEKIIPEITEEVKTEEPVEETQEEVEETETIQENIVPEVEEMPEVNVRPEPVYENIESSSYASDDEEKAEENKTEKTPLQQKIESVTSRGFKIAVVRQPENKLCNGIFSEIEVIHGTQFVDFSIDNTLQDDAKRKENIASNARKAMMQSQSNFSVAASEVYFTESNQAYIFIALADSQKASVYKVLADANDSATDLYRDGIENAVEKIEETIKTADFVSVPVPSYVAPPVQSNPAQNKKMPSSTLFLMWVLIIIAMAALTVLVLDFVMPESSSLLESSSEIIAQANDFLLR